MSASGGVKVTRLHELLRNAKPLRYWSRYNITQLLTAPRSGKLSVTEARARLEEARKAYKELDEYFQKQGVDQVSPDCKLGKYWESILTNFANKHIPNNDCDKKRSPDKVNKDNIDN